MSGLKDQQARFFGLSLSVSYLLISSAMYSQNRLSRSAILSNSSAEK
jgi:hypothetical protein